MARPGGEQTRERIRAAVAELVATRGVDSFTLDDVAERVGVTRQAVLYHFGSRERLLAESMLPVLAAESSAMVAAAETGPEGLAGVGAFLDKGLDWYLEDPNRFRLLYAVTQLTPLVPTLDPETLQERVYPVTGRIYGTLEERLAGDAPEGVDPRKLGIALHMFLLGVASYQGMLEACGETFAHDWHDIADALAKALTSDEG